MIIDDDESIVRLVKKILEENGYRVQAARNADVGLELARNINPNCVILDLIMPGKDGYQTLKEIKSKAETKEISVIMLTVKKEDREIQRCLDAGAEDYLMKPINMNLMLKRIESIMKVTRQTA